MVNKIFLGTPKRANNKVKSINDHKSIMHEIMIKLLLHTKSDDNIVNKFSNTTN